MTLWIIEHGTKNMLALNYYKLWLYYFHVEMWNSLMLKYVKLNITCDSVGINTEAADTFWWGLGNNITGFCTLIT